MGTAITHCMHSLSRFHHYVDVPMSHISLSFLSLCLSPFGLPLHVTQLLSSTASSKASWMIWMARMLNESPEPCTFTHTHTRSFANWPLYWGEPAFPYCVAFLTNVSWWFWVSCHSHTHSHTWLSGTKMKACSTVYVEQTCMWYGVCWSLCSRKKANLHVW